LQKIKDLNDLALFFHKFGAALQKPMTMKKATLLLLAGITIFASCEKDKEDTGMDMGKLHISKSKPMPGDSLTLTYQPTDSLAETYGMLNVLVDYKMYPQDIALVKEGDVLKGKFQVPDSATAFALNFQHEDEYDNNDKKGYVLSLYDTDGKALQGGASSAAYYKVTRGAEYGIKYDKDSAAAVLKKGWADTGNMTYLYTISQADKTFADSIYDSKLASFVSKEKLTEDEYKDLITIYNAKKNKAAIDSITTIIIEKYPTGDQAQRAYYQKMYAAKSLDEKEAVAAEFEAAGGQATNYGNYMYSALAQAEVAAGNIDKFQEVASKIQDKGSRASLYNNIAWNMAEKGENLPLAAQLSKKSLDLLKENSGDKPDFYTTRQYADMMDRNTQMYTDTYAFTQYKNGNIKEALSLQENIVGEGKNNEYNERYLLYLTESGDNEKAVEKAEEFIENNAANAKVKEYYKAAFAKSNAGGDFDARLAMLEEKGREKAFDELKKEIIDEDAPKFALLDMDGNEVALNSLKGKTVIVDFWATWCGPCIASFPAMQKAQEKYTANGDVEFVFINTWENVPQEQREKSVASFLEKKQLPFHVLLDTRDKDENYEIVSDYEVDGIPTKFVVGPDGNIKFKAVGWGGNDDALVDEIGMMIELAKS
tara:strand:+ start:2531 stop:4486 length:1956 start_codon:yes stop_codon:yes gene_type:complete